MAKALTAPQSPDATSRAMELMDEDADFSDGEQPAVMRLFTKEINVARTYISTSKKSRRTAYIRAILADDEL